MQTVDVQRLLDDEAEARGLLQSWGLRDPVRAHDNLVRIAAAGVTLDLMAVICEQLAENLPRVSDADMALNNLERFVQATRSPLSLAALFERDREALPILLRIFSTSQHLSDVLITDSESYDLLRATEGRPVHRDTLVDEFCNEIQALVGEPAVMAALRRVKRRETLRIAYGDLIRGQRLHVVTEQISYLADTILEGALLAANRKLQESRGVPRTASGERARFVILGMGKLGGTELNYSSDIDLICLYEGEGVTDGPRSISNDEYFQRLVREIVHLLTTPTEVGTVYRVDLRLRPNGKQGPLAYEVEHALQYYDKMGRTWERQAFVKARPVAGDLDLGHQFLEQLRPWIYRRYLGLADITGIKALKRRIEQRTIKEKADHRDVKSGHGGIRDIEFTIQFLQLLHGCEAPQLQTGNTLKAMDQLERIGCLTLQERSLLEKNYQLLRNIEHRLQLMFDLQTHVLPEEPEELQKLAIRLGYADKPGQTALDAFRSDYKRITAENRKILNHLLHNAFKDDDETRPEVDLILDPDPPAEQIEAVFSRYGFREPQRAYEHMQALATERIPFLSTRRCRHFLASIAPALLREIARTPDPDATLVTLEKVSDSLGGKGALWELFSFNPPSLRLYVDLCATSSFLCSILISNPGMIDELLDSLMLDKLPRLETLRAALADLCRAAEDLDPILHSFKNAQLLRVGARDILGKEDVAATTAALSNVAQVCLEQIANRELARLIPKLGEPQISNGPRAGEPCNVVIVAMGKFGGGEISYHSDLDIIFLYEDEGYTVATSRTASPTSNQHFFSQLGQKIIKTATFLGPYGRLYDIDARLRPTGKSGSLATSLAEFARYYASGEGQLWERQALCRARVVYGPPEAAAAAEAAIAKAAFDHPFGPDDVRAIRDMRRRMEDTASPSNLKRGAGGIVDIEFAVQLLQLKYGRDNPKVRQPATFDALAALAEEGYLSADDAQFLTNSYRLLRRVENRLRLIYGSSRDDLPTEADERDKLARQLGYADGAALTAELERVTAETRARFNRLLDDHER